MSAQDAVLGAVAVVLLAILAYYSFRADKEAADEVERLR